MGVDWPRWVRRLAALYVVLVGVVAWVYVLELTDSTAVRDTMGNAFMIGVGCSAAVGFLLWLFVALDQRVSQRAGDTARIISLVLTVPVWVGLLS